MDEIKKTVTQSSLYHDPTYRYIYLWAVYRLPSVRILYTVSSLVIVYMLIQIITILIRFKVFLYKDSFLLLMVIIYLHVVIPYIKFFVSRKKTIKTFGRTYDMILNKTGLRINHTFIDWQGKYRVLECKYGIVIISFHKILAVISRNSLSEEEFSILRKWAGLLSCH